MLHKVAGENKVTHRSFSRWLFEGVEVIMLKIKLQCLLELKHERGTFNCKSSGQGFGKHALRKPVFM